MTLISLLRKSTFIASTASVLALAAAAPAQDNGAADRKAESAKFNSYYRGTKVWLLNSHGEAYNKIITPGAVLTVRVPGIYADVANLRHAMPLTTIENGIPTHRADTPDPSSSSSGPRELKPGETVFITELKLKNDILHFEILTTDMVQLGAGTGTRYRAELDFHIPNLQTINRADDLITIIEPIISEQNTAVAPPASAEPAAQSKTVDIGMTTEQVKQILGAPEKTMNLGPKTIFVYKDVKVIFRDAKVADVQ